MKILVGGGSGFIGRHLRTLMESKGHEMVNVSRRAVNPKDLTWKHIERYGLPAGIESVVNLSGVNIMSPVRWTEKFQNEVLSSRLDTTKILANAANTAEEKPKSFIAISAIGYYGVTESGVDLAESAPPGDGFPAELCKQWEEAAAVDTRDIRKVTVRIGLVLGPTGGMMASLYWPFFFGVGGTIGNGTQWFPWIHADDVAGIILHAIENSHVTGVLNAVAPQSVTNADFTKMLASSMCRFAVIPLPGFAIKAILGETRGEMMLSSPKIVPQRTLESGYKFLYPDLKTACEDCVRW